MTLQARLATLTLALLASTAIAVGAAPAQTSDAPISVKVQFAGLDLNHEAGARTMLQRIDVAARRACGGEPDLRSLDRRPIYARCHRETVVRAVTALNAPLVTAAAAGIASSGATLAMAGN